MSDNQSGQKGVGGVAMHTLECPECEHEFYVKLPSLKDVDENEETVYRETECVECNEKIERSYIPRRKTEKKVDVEISYEVTDDD